MKRWEIWHKSGNRRLIIAAEEEASMKWKLKAWFPLINENDWAIFEVCDSVVYVDFTKDSTRGKVA